MLYHFSNISFLDLVLDYTALFNENDVLVLDKSVIFRINYPEDQNILLQLISFSKNTKTIIICCTKIVYEDIFSGAIVIEKGQFIGITKQIIVKKTYKGGKTIDAYDLCNKCYVIVLNEDIFIPNVISKILKLEPDYILHINQDNYNFSKCAILAAVSVKNNIKVYSMFNDGSFFYDKNGAFKQIEIGNIRRMKMLK